MAGREPLEHRAPRPGWTPGRGKKGSAVNTTLPQQFTSLEIDAARGLLLAERTTDGTYRYEPGRVCRAADLVRAGAVERDGAGCWLVVSSDGSRAYHVDGGTCNCPDWARYHHCKHSLSARLVEIIERSETDAEQAPARPPVSDAEYREMYAELFGDEGA